MPQLSDALHSGDIDQVRVQAHTIRGASANIGAPRMHEVALQLEALAQGGGLAGGTALFEALRREEREFRGQAK